MPRRRSRAVDRALPWFSLIAGAILLYHEFWVVPAKDYTWQRIPLLIVAAGLFTVTLTKPGGPLGALVSWFARQDQGRRTGGDG